MRLGLAARLALGFSLLVATTALVTTLAGMVSTRSVVRSDVDRFLQDRVEEIASGQRQARPRPGTNDNGRSGLTNESEAVIDQAVQTAVEADAEVQTLNSRGEVLTTEGIALPVNEIDIELARRPGRPVLRNVTIDGRDYRLVTAHIEGEGAVQVARNLGGTNDLLKGIQSRMVTTGLVLSLLAAGVGWFVARGTTRPLRRLTDSVESIAETQDLSLSVGLDRSDEVGRLAKSFDRMLGALRQSREQQHQLVHDAAHELRTPLTSIHANVDLLSRAPDLDEAVRQETFAAVRSELRQLNVLFTEIIELATDAHNTPAYQPIDLATVVESAVRSFQARSTATIDFRAESSIVSGHAPSLERVVGNLLGNAEKYSPPGSPITVEVRGGTVSVADHGPGIPAAEQARVFDRFYRSDEARSQPGSGLGLAIVKKIVTDHGGQPWIEDGPEGGTRVGFTLPPAV